MVTKTIRGNNLYDTERHIRSTFPTLWISGKKDWQGSGQFLSDDGHGHVCTVTGATWGVQGRTFDGNDVITIPDADSLDIGTSDFSIGVWVKTAAIGMIAYKVGTGDIGYYLYINSTTTIRLSLRTSAGATDFNCALAVTDNVWHEVTFTVDRDSATGLKAYKDGVLADTKDPTGRQLTLASDGNLFLGASTALGADGLVGTMGEVLIYNGRALSAVEVQRNYLATAWRNR